MYYFLSQLTVVHPHMSSGGGGGGGSGESGLSRELHPSGMADKADVARDQQVRSNRISLVHMSNYIRELITVKRLAPTVNTAKNRRTLKRGSVLIKRENTEISRRK